LNRNCVPASVAQARGVGYGAPKEAHMSYVKHVLQAGEEIRHYAKVHWIIYFWGLIFMALALVLFVVGEMATRGRSFWLICAGLLAIVALLQLFQAWWKAWNTEICVTNKRIIYKKGFISRDTVEMQMDKVGSVDVKQSVLGRILDYGNVTLIGPGGQREPLPGVASPIELRNHITGN